MANTLNGTPLTTAQQLKMQPQSSICYVLGAGFSRATRFQFPTSVGFLSREFKIRECDDSEETVNVAHDHWLKSAFDRIEENYGDLAQLNLESVMDDLHVKIFGIGRAWESSRPGRRPELTDLKSDYEAINRYVRKQLSLEYDPNLDCPLVQRFAESLKTQDSIVTLNYDTILEAHLSRFSVEEDWSRLEAMAHAIVPPGHSMGGMRSPMFPKGLYQRKSFSKLHGSIDWFTCPNENCPNHVYIQPVGTWFSNVVRSPGGGRCDCCAWEPECVIVPPTAAKVFERFPKINQMWHNAYCALQYAERWTIIGVSLAVTDGHLAALLRSASRDAVYLGSDNRPGQICIVDPESKPVLERLTKSLHPKVVGLLKKHESIRCFKTVEEYLVAIEEIDACREHRVVTQ